MSGKHIWKYLFISVMTTFAVSLFGCRFFPESTFELARDSRLPNWIVLPIGATRHDITLTMNYYTGSSVSYVLRDNRRHATQEIDGNEACVHHFTLREAKSNYPSYIPVAVNGTVEIMEHKKMEPIFYVTDDTAVWQQYKANGCN